LALLIRVEKTCVRGACACTCVEYLQYSTGQRTLGGGVASVLVWIGLGVCVRGACACTCIEYPQYSTGQRTLGGGVASVLVWIGLGVCVRLAAAGGGCS
jgi:hypothetical protein